MNHDGRAVPNKNYFETIAQGYRDFNLIVPISIRPLKMPMITKKSMNFTGEMNEEKKQEFNNNL